MVEPESDRCAAALPEPPCYIGDNYHRFYSHFVSVDKSKTNPYQYIITGKTKVKRNVSRFSGIINILIAGPFKKQFGKKYKQGFVECFILFYEDSMQSLTEFFKGMPASRFYLMKIGDIS